VARPIVPRTRETYRRDVEALGRLRTAVQLDKQLKPVRVASVLKHIDALVTELVEAFEHR